MPLNRVSTVFSYQPSGYIINVMKNSSRYHVEAYKDVFDTQCRKWVEEGRWERIYEHVNPNYFMKQYGLVQVYRRKDVLEEGGVEKKVTQVVMIWVKTGKSFYDRMKNSQAS